MTENGNGNGEVIQGSAPESHSPQKSPLVGGLRAKLKAHFSELEAEIKRIEQITSPLRAERDKLQAEIQPTENRMRELAKQYNQIERDAGLYELKNDLAETARSLGGKSLRNAPEQAEFVAGSEQEQQPQGETVETVNYGGTDHEWSEEGSTAGDSGKDQPQS